MDASNHYEAAFRAYLHQQGFAYVGVDETRRSQLGDASVKNLDFIVHGDGGARLLVDVKGRRYPTGGEGRLRRVWESWSTADDVAGLERWEQAFGPGYLGLLVFVYQLLPDVPVAPDTEDLWQWRERRYLLRAVPAADYRQHMRVRSPRWGTVALPRAAYRELARPFRHFAAPVELPCLDTALEA